MSRLDMVPDDVMIQACRDLQLREENAGSWPGGEIPMTMFKVCQGLKLDESSVCWLMVAESYVRAWAVRQTLKLTDVIKAHDLCHNQHGKVDATAFAEGCVVEQRKLYGRAPHADLLVECHREFYNILEWRADEPMSVLNDDQLAAIREKIAKINELLNSDASHTT